MPNLNRAAAAPWAVFTDLDGTLLDHDTYTFDPARALLGRLAGDGIPLVLATSKTRAEADRIWHELAMEGPVIAENGAIVAFPPGWGGGSVHCFSPTYPDLVEYLEGLRRQHGFRFRGFRDMGPEGVAELTGLAPPQAAAACVREGSEPILWEDSEPAFDAFSGYLAARGLKMLQGGRLKHVLGAGADKARGLGVVLALLRQRGWQGHSIALGDAPNDHGMLCAADIPVIVRNPSTAEMPPINHPRLLRTRDIGPAGWREAVEQILNAAHGGGS